MGGEIYLIQGDNELVEMTEKAYDSEDALQELLARHPNLLAGEEMQPGEPRRWLLVRREMGIPDDEEASDRWPVDHLFLDQDAIPTLVEVKRSSDSRIRREVVGQMLDYGANAVAYWPVARLQARFEQLCEDESKTPEQRIRECFGDDLDPEDFWQKVKTNLQAGRVRMVFVADEIPAELRRIVEFLNSQMDPAEVFAVEIKQFVGQGQRTLVPRLLGQTEQAKRKKAVTARAIRNWDDASFCKELERVHGLESVRVARRILDWATGHGLDIDWGGGPKQGGFSPVLKHAGVKHKLVTAWTYGYLEVHFATLRTRPPYDEPERRHELFRRLNEVPGVDFPASRIESRPSVKLSELADEGVLEQLLAVLEWGYDEIRRAGAGAQ